MNIDASPNIIKVLTPKYKYKNTIQNSNNARKLLQQKRAIFLSLKKS